MSTIPPPAKVNPPETESSSNDDPEKGEMPKEDVKKLLQRNPLGLRDLFDRGMSNVQYTFFSFAFGSLFNQSTSSVVSLIFFIIFILWIFFADFVRRRVPKLEHLNITFAWMAVLMDLVDFVSVIGLLIAFNLVFLFFSTAQTFQNINRPEIIAGTVIMMITMFCAIRTFDGLSRL
jgi:hypothetical protein